MTAPHDLTAAEATGRPRCWPALVLLPLLLEAAIAAAALGVLLWRHGGEELASAPPPPTPKPLPFTPRAAVVTHCGGPPTGTSVDRPGGVYIPLKRSDGPTTAFGPCPGWEGWAPAGGPAVMSLHLQVQYPAIHCQVTLSAVWGDPPPPWVKPGRAVWYNGMPPGPRHPLLVEPGVWRWRARADRANLVPPQQGLEEPKSPQKDGRADRANLVPPRQGDDLTWIEVTLLE